jgi:uncharacterized ion transporter superfamily protein YfcC
MKKLIKFLEGKKTFLIALGTVLYAVIGSILGYVDQQMATELVLGALGLASLRSTKKLN